MKHLKLFEEFDIKKPMKKESFFNWYEIFKKENPHLEWEWLLTTLINDESSTDSDLKDLFTENDIKSDIIQELLSHRTDFINYGLEL